MSSFKERLRAVKWASRVLMWLDEKMGNITYTYIRWLSNFTPFVAIFRADPNARNSWVPVQKGFDAGVPSHCYSTVSGVSLMKLNWFYRSSWSATKFNIIPALQIATLFYAVNYSNWVIWFMPFATLEMRRALCWLLRVYCKNSAICPTVQKILRNRKAEIFHKFSLVCSCWKLPYAKTATFWHGTVLRISLFARSLI